jgi:hypothetical protein
MIYLEVLAGRDSCIVPISSLIFCGLFMFLLRPFDLEVLPELLLEVLLSDLSPAASVWPSSLSFITSKYQFLKISQNVLRHRKCNVVYTKSYIIRHLSAVTG